MSLLRTSSLSLVAVLAAALLTSPAAAQAIPFDRSIQKIEVDTAGGAAVLRILVGLVVSDPTNDPLDLSCDVAVARNGEPIDQFVIKIKKGGAITCAVTCAGSCPSIFGDGVCAGCGCRYSDWFTSPLPGGEPAPGDVISVSLRAAPGAAPELDTSNDKAKLTVAKLSPMFRRGDTNGDAQVDIGDPIALLGCLFSGGKCPTCEDAADANDDGNLDMSDPIYELAWLFLGGAAPPAPGPVECGVDPTPDRLAACSLRDSACAAPPVDEEPTLVDAASRLLYAARASREPAGEPDDEPEPRRGGGDHGPREVVYEPRQGPGFSWNSPVGRRMLIDAGEVGEDVESSAAHPIDSIEHEIATSAGESFCVDPRFYVSAGDRIFTGWESQTFQAPANAFASKAAAESFLLSVHAEQPFFLPFTHPDVHLGHGWYYNDGGLHRACDYSRSGVEENEDPTFVVRSSSWGEVVAVTWDGNGGNVVAVEHTAPGGQKIMICYLHLRNGRSHDVFLAKSSTSSDAKYVKYRAFANGYPNHLSWGTESHKILVKVGDHLSPGDPIGYAGNTGAGGAGGGLNDDGSPKDWRGNVHLHVYFAVPHPTVEDTWVWIDPYGVYDEVVNGCYDLLKSTKFSRIYAPFYPTFHAVPFEVFAYYWGYYPDMGMKLRTLSVHRKDSKLLVSGSFQSGIAGGWHFQAYVTPQRFQEKSDEYWLSDYVARETGVTKTLGGAVRYTGIWRKLEPGEHIEHRGSMSAGEWADEWQDRVVDDGWRVEDYFGFDVAGGERVAALFTSNDPRPFALYRNRTSAEMDAIVDENAPKGLLPVSFNVAELSGGTKLTGIFRHVSGCWKVFWGRTSAQYQSLVDDQVSKGYRVWKVQGYANSSKYAVIFQRDGAGPCP